MPHSQSNLISLANLLRTAEARQSAMPPPATATPGAIGDDSGVIDILAMQRKAQEERASLSTRTPVPVVSTVVRSAETDPDILATSVRAKQKRKRILGFVGAGALFVGAVFAIGAATSSASPPPPVAAAAPPVVVAPPTPAVVIPPPPPAPVVEPIVPAAPEAVASSEGHPKKGHKGAKGKHKAKSSGGPKLMKVTSAGVVAG